MDTEDLAQLKTLRLDVQEFKGLIGLGFCLKYNKIEINITSKIVSFSISIYKVLTFYCHLNLILNISFLGLDIFTFCCFP